jgi:hypothetical protein
MSILHILCCNGCLVTWKVVSLTTAVVTNRFSLCTLGSDPIENTVYFCRVLLCYLATRCSTIHREHSYYWYVFAGKGILSHSLAMSRYLTIYIYPFSTSTRTSEYNLKIAAVIDIFEYTEYPKSVTELLRLEEKRFLQRVCYFINSIPIFI